ncbi:WD40/YVTN/BNR-like repeat-containing protein [Erythrobacter sp. WG]|uniref:WD40/YVTN/BNR-like repeat-containing protein n=1 Tax=Erythrobacter sp. WG TaxID=2985510 RepID=UPI00226FE0FB|nr:hypothetical protein [Erythrobacter sp. WG]MCX9146533.1 hypothetical protein [Erythrobacter sp. WG]
MQTRLLTALAALTLPAPLAAQGSQPAATAAPAAADGWRTFATEAYRGKRDSVSFVDPDHGWYGTGAGDLFATTDGGATWTKVASRPGTFVRAVGFVDRLDGFIGNIGTDYYPGVTDTTPLYRTRDGGKTWEAVDTGAATIKGVCAIDILKTQRIYQGTLVPRTVIHAAGRVGGPTGILRSVDGGDTWSVIDMARHAGMILDVTFFDENTGLVFAATNADPAQAEGLVLRTEDGGKTWKEVYRSGRRFELIWKASFPEGSDTGYATVQSYDPERATQLVIRSDDRGRTWREIEMAQDKTARQFGIGFVSKDVGFVGTAAGGFATKDGGRTWERAPIARAANKFETVPTDKGVRVYAIGTEVQAIDLPLLPKR